VNQRLNGFYWIRDVVNGELRFQVAEFNEGQWYLCGSDDYFYDDNFSKSFRVVAGPLSPPADADYADR
jgi:hypothetical protein